MLGWMALVALAVSGDGPGSGVEPVLALEQAGRDDAALAMAEELAAQPPASALAHLEAARLGLKLGRETADVQRHLDAVRGLAPENPRLHYLSGLVREGQGDDAAARAAYLESVALRSDYAEARTRLVALATRSRDWALAEAQLRGLIASGDRSAARRLQLAHVLEEASRPAEAEVLLKALHREEPKNATVTTALADLYTRQGRTQEALALRRPAPAKKLRPLQPSRH